MGAAPPIPASEPARAILASDLATSSARKNEAPSKPRAIPELGSDGWVSVPNSGKLPIDVDGDLDRRGDDAGPAGEAASTTTRDLRAHAAKDVSFELESPRVKDAPELAQVAQPGAGGETARRAGPVAGRVESVPHVVERGENFWTISRLYYSSGRYYRALWKANAGAYPDIRKLKVGDVIMVPPVEDLDSAYIDPPRSRVPVDLQAALRSSAAVPRAGAGGDGADGGESSGSSSSATMTEPAATSRASRGPGAGGVAVRRSSGNDPDLDLPPPSAGARRSPVVDRTGRRTERPLGDDEANDDDPPTARSTARSRLTGAARTRRPAYKVRQGDTLRSIARDMLGDSHRASEVLELNRDLIDDSSHLIVGQILQLPEDARTGVRRSASR
jgi:nucleoid-associated protein YgaU